MNDCLPLLVLVLPHEIIDQITGSFGYLACKMLNLDTGGNFLPRMNKLEEVSMSVAVTQAALVMEEAGNELSPHAVIQLLLDGALERLDEAALKLNQGNEEEAGQLMTKAIGIINGLRESLDFERGGEMALKLDRLYGYLITRLAEAEVDTGEVILSESTKLLSELKSGWDAIAA